MACITKRRGRYVIDCYDQNGQRYRKTMKAGTTKEDTRKELRDIEAKIEHRTFMHDKKTPLFSDVKKEWLKHKKQFLRETTYEVYETNCRLHLSGLDGLKINRIDTATIETFISELQEKAKSTRATRMPEYILTGKEQKIRLMTARKIIVILNQIMAYAVRHRMIDYNPVRDAERPRNQGKEDQEKTISILTPEQIRNFLEAVTDQKYKTLFLTAIMTGARQGEILGLKWSDVDFQKKQISINRTFNMGRFFTPKTKGSARRIDLSPMAVKALAEWKLASGGQSDANYEEEIKELEEKERVLMDQLTETNKAEDESPSLSRQIAEIREKVKRLRGAPLVFPNESGEPMNYSNMVQRYYRKALKAAGIPQIRFHDLRHTYASLLLSQGENVKYIQTQLGHSSPTVTLNVYSHLLKETNQGAVCRLENTIFQATGHNLVTNKEKGLTVNG